MGISAGKWWSLVLCGAAALLLSARAVAAQPSAALPTDTAAGSPQVLWPDSASLAAADTANSMGTPQIKVVRRGYKYREQLRLALFMMGFIALALTTAQTFNPD